MLVRFRLLVTNAVEICGLGLQSQRKRYMPVQIIGPMSGLAARAFGTQCTAQASRDARSARGAGVRDLCGPKRYKPSQMAFPVIGRASCCCQFG